MPVEIAIHVGETLPPGSRKCFAFFLKNDVMSETERSVRLRAGVLGLIIEAESKDIVFDFVFFAVVLMEATALASVDQII